MFIDSKYQKEIYNEIEHGTGHLSVEALAGSGKTYTIIQSLKHIPANISWRLLAFNRETARKLKELAPPGGEVSTLHSLGWQTCSKSFKFFKNDDKISLILEQLLTAVGCSLKDFFELKGQMYQLIPLAKSFLANIPEDIDNIMDNYDIEPLQASREGFIQLALDVLEQSKNITNMLDYSDLIWFPEVFNLKVNKTDITFIDEAQDLTLAERKLALRSIYIPGEPGRKKKKPGRMIIVGDTYQSINSFKGAETDSIAKFAEILEPKKLPLSITYRCARLIVEEAQKYVPHLEAAPDAIEGLVDKISFDSLMTKARPGCFVLSRTNAPLVPLALEFLSRKIPCNIQGRNIGNNLCNIIYNSKAKKLSDLLTYLEKWLNSEQERLLAKGYDTSAILDKGACLFKLIEQSSSIEELLSIIDHLFADSDDTKKIILSTVHRAKGLERDIVYLLWNTFSSRNQEELNIKYIGISRAKKALYYVN